MTHYQHKSVNIYTFTAAETDNKAKFRCEATNPYLASPLTANLELTVLFPPSKVGKKTFSIRINIGTLYN